MRGAGPIADFCRAAQESEDAARALLRADPALVERSVCAAAAAGDAAAVAVHLQRDPALAAAPEEATGAPPLAALVGSRFPEPALAECARALLEAGAELGARALFGAAARGRFALLEVFASLRDVHAVRGARGMPLLHWCLDECFTPELLDWLLDHGADPNAAAGPFGESALHVAARRRRGAAVERLIDRGADLEARTAGGMTAWRHALRRGFGDVDELLRARGADTTTTPGDELAAALVAGREDEAREILAAHPELVPGMGPEEARLLPDLAARGAIGGMRLLLDAGIDVDARGLDGGTGLQVAAWFAEPAAARLFLERGADPNAGGDDHDSTPLGWVAHGSRYSGGARGNQAQYAEIAEALLAAGARLAHPANPDDRYGEWLLVDATEAVAEVLRRYGARG